MENLTINANYIKVENVITDFIDSVNDTRCNIDRELLAMFFNHKNLLSLCDFKTPPNSKLYNVIGTNYMFTINTTYDVPVKYFDNFIYINISPFLDIVKLAYDKIYDLRHQGYYYHTHKKLNSTADSFFDKLIDMFSTYTTIEILEIVQDYYFDVEFKQREEWQLINNSETHKQNLIIKHKLIKHNYFKSIK